MSVVLEVKEQVGERATILNIDIDKNPGFAESSKVETVPTLIIYSEGERSGGRMVRLQCTKSGSAEYTYRIAVTVLTYTYNRNQAVFSLSSSQRISFSSSSSMMRLILSAAFCKFFVREISAHFSSSSFFPAAIAAFLFRWFPARTFL